MPFIQQGSTTASTAELFVRDYQYDYPEGLNLRPGSDLHQRVVDRVMQRVNDSRKVMENRYTDWDKLDQSLTSYIPSDLEEKNVKANDERKPTSIVVPVSFAIEETFCTYLAGAFLESPIFWYQGVGPEDTLGAILMELLVDLQCNRNKVALNLMTFIKDGIRYGFGVTAPIWKKSYGRKVSNESSTSDSSAWREVLFEGNALLNVDPREYLPDPNVPINDVQSGEFTGWVSKSNALALLDREAQGEDFFNCKYLRHVSGLSRFARKNSVVANTNRDMMELSSPGTSTKPIDVIYMYVNLIPKEWELGTSEYPEKWLFAVASDTLLIQAKPLGLEHQLFPVAVWAPLFDGYSICPTTPLEIFSGLQGVLDFLFNSHIKNVRKALNDMFIVDPSLIHMPDVQNPYAGLMVRMREKAWGRGVNDAMKQFPVTDVTRQHIQDSMYITEMIQRVSGASDAVQGIVRAGGERRSATEMRDAKVSALSRMERMGRVLSMQAMSDIGYMFACHTQQLMTQDTYVRAIGRWEQTLRTEYGQMMPPPGSPIPISPEMLMVEFDVIPKDNTMSGKENVESLLMGLQIATGNPILASQIDLVRNYLHLMRMMGVKNVQEFLLKTPVQVMPDEQVQQQAQAGNLQPMQGMGGAGMMGGGMMMGGMS